MRLSEFYPDISSAVVDEDWPILREAIMQMMALEDKIFSPNFVLRENTRLMEQYARLVTLSNTQQLREGKLVQGVNEPDDAYAARERARKDRDNARRMMKRNGIDLSDPEKAARFDTKRPKAGKAVQMPTQTRAQSDEQFSQIIRKFIHAANVTFGANFMAQFGADDPMDPSITTEQLFQAVSSVIARCDEEPDNQRSANLKAFAEKILDADRSIKKQREQDDLKNMPTPAEVQQNPDEAAEKLAVEVEQKVDSGEITPEEAATEISDGVKELGKQKGGIFLNAIKKVGGTIARIAAKVAKPFAYAMSAFKFGAMFAFMGPPGMVLGAIIGVGVAAITLKMGQLGAKVGGNLGAMLYDWFSKAMMSSKSKALNKVGQRLNSSPKGRKFIQTVCSVIGGVAAGGLTAVGLHNAIQQSAQAIATAFTAAVPDAAVIAESAGEELTQVAQVAEQQAGLPADTIENSIAAQANAVPGDIVNGQTLTQGDIQWAKDVMTQRQVPPQVADNVTQELTQIAQVNGGQIPAENAIEALTDAGVQADQAEAIIAEVVHDVAPAGGLEDFGTDVAAHVGEGGPMHQPEPLGITNTELSQMEPGEVIPETGHLVTEPEIANAGNQVAVGAGNQEAIQTEILGGNVRGTQTVHANEPGNYHATTSSTLTGVRLDDIPNYHSVKQELMMNTSANGRMAATVLDARLNSLIAQGIDPTNFGPQTLRNIATNGNYSSQIVRGLVDTRV